MKQALINQCSFADNEKVLDFGVGTATLSVMIRQRYPSVKITGIDVDNKILEIAGKKAGSAIQLLQYDGSHIPFPDNSFDKIVSSLVLHHIPTANKKPF